MTPDRTPVRTPARALIHDEACRQATAVVEFVGRRWSSAILLALDRGATRFNEICAMVEGLSARMLAVRMRELENAELVDRSVEPTTPVAVRYTLTPRGKELISALHGLVAYGQRWGP